MNFNKAIQAAASTFKKMLEEQAQSKSAGDGTARRKDNMAGMAIEAKKGGLIKKDKLKMVMKGGRKVPSFAADGVGKMKKGGMADKTGRAMTRKTADTKGRAMKGK
jgi:hypothetical protein